MDFRNFLKENIVILDGATGSNLQKAGMKSGDCPEQWIVEHPDVFIELQKSYIEAGSDVLYTPTFTCNRIKLEEYGLADRQEQLTEELVSLTKKAIAKSGVERPVYIAGDISMTGKQLEPVGDMPFELLVDVYKEQISLLAQAGVDLLVVETMMSLQECRAALIAAKETCDLPVMVTLTYQEDGRTLFGTSPETAMVVLQSMGADAVGINCSTGPDKMIDAVKKMAEYANVPMIVKPNAGLPTLVNQVTTYDMGPAEFADAMMPLLEAGATVFGGCCGTTPEHIRQMAKKVKTGTKRERAKKCIRVLTTERDVTPISLDGNFVVVGERINPTGKKALQEELKQGSLDMVLDMAEEQVACGARVLDVNMGMNGIDEGDMMCRAVKELTLTVNVPLSIDSSYVDVVERALRIYPGRALINSISMEKEKMERLLPIAKKYGAMFILLPLSEAGLPKDLQEKKDIIHAILEEAGKYDLSKDDVVADGLVTTVGANKKAALEVLETIAYCKQELGIATICGLSNISFGLPERSFINTAFLTMAIEKGLTMAIANPQQTLLMNAALATDLLLNKQEADIAYIDGVSAATITQEKVNKTEKEEAGHPVFTAVMKGKNKQIVPLLEDEIKKGTKPGDIIDNHLIPAINRVGELFEQKTYFLPQLIASAETMELAIRHLEPFLEEERGREKLATVVIATVKGDIHDIGKNLVALMLRNYGYDVIDLGKDVEAETIVDAAKKTGAQVIGLSALMTTTMMEMKTVIDRIKEEKLDVKVMIGGAVVTDSFKKEIGADGYAEDAQEAVKCVNELLR